MGARRRVAVVAAIAAVLLLLSMTAGCGGGSERDEPKRDERKRDERKGETSTSTGRPGVAAPDAPPPVAPISESELRRRTDDAVASSTAGDPCPLYEVVVSVVPDVSTPAAGRRAYRIINRALARVDARVDLADSWSALIEATATEVSTGGSGVGFAGAEVRRALDALDAACRAG